MSEAYIVDKNARDNGVTRTYHEFSIAINSVTPSNVRIGNIVPVKNNFIVKYNQETDVNHLLKPDVIDKLLTYNLIPQLTTDSAKKREIFLTNVPDSIYEKPAEEIMTEIRKITDKIIYINPIISKSSNRKYIILTAESNSARDNILSNNSMQLFSQTINIEPPIDKNKSRYSIQGNFRNPGPPRAPMYDLNQPHPQSHSARYPGNHTGSNMIPRPQPRCPPPPPINPWTESQHWPHVSPQSQLPREKSRPTFNFDSDTYINFVIKATINIIEQLHEGKENPFEFVNGINGTFVNQGLASIDIPYDQILLSRKIYERKSSPPHACNHTIPSSQASPPSTTTSHPSSTITTAPAPINTHSPPIPTIPISTIQSSIQPPTPLYTSIPPTSNITQEPISLHPTSTQAPTSLPTSTQSISSSSNTPTTQASTSPPPSSALSQPDSGNQSAITSISNSSLASPTYSHLTPISSPPAATAIPTTESRITRRSGAINS